MPRINIPEVGEVEFPDTMAVPEITAAAKKLHREAMSAKQIEADKKLYSPAETGFLGNVLPAAGSGMANVIRALGGGKLMGVMGLPTTKEEADAQDEPLNNAPGGTIGRALGSAALLAPAAFIPGANTYLGATAIGAGAGALTTEGNIYDRLKGGASGAVGGLAGNAIGRAIPVAWGLGKGLLQPFTQGGRDKIAGDTIKRFATDPAALATASVGRTITGAAPTLAEATKDPGIATLQRAIGSMDPDAAAMFLARGEQNNAARLNALQSVAGDVPVASKVKALSRIASGPTQTAAESARGAAANVSYEAARKSGVDASMANALTPQIESLMSRPSMTAAAEGAKRLAKEEGINIADAGGSAQGLLYMKQSLDDAIGALGPRELNQKRLLTQTSSDLKSLLDDIAPQLRSADAEFAAKSVPVNRAAVGNRLLESTTGALRDFSGNRPLQANAYARALNNERQLIKQATGRNSPQSLEDFMTPTQMGRINGVRDELELASNLSRAANGPGSQTAKMLASQNLVKNVAGPLGIPESWLESTLSQTLMRGPQFALKSAEERIQQSIAQGLLSPAEGQRLVLIAQKAAAAKPSDFGLLTRAMAPGLLGYGAAQVNQ
jgi:hypothetical protein